MSLKKRLNLIWFLFLLDHYLHSIETKTVNTKASKLLLIENNLMDANYLAKMLDEHCEKFEVKYAKRIKDAVYNLEDHDFDAVLLNLSLADSQGISTLDAIQQKAPQLPIIILTTIYNPNLAVQSLRKGAQDYLVKSELTSNVLVRSIQYAIERQHIEFSERQQVLMKQIVDKIRNSIDLETVLKTTVDEVQQFLNTEQVLIYHCPSERTEDILVVSSSLDNLSVQRAVVRFISAMNFNPCGLAKSQSICIKAIEDSQVESTKKYFPSKAKLAKSYLSLPIHVGDLNNYAYKDLTHPLIEQNDLKESSAELWGMLIAYNTQISRKWHDWEISFLQKLTTQVSIAIQQSQLWNKLHLANQKLQQLAISDGLTGIANRRYFDLVLNNEWKRSTREQQPLSLILCDIDYFKAYNDTYGHQKGDRCLQKIAAILQKHTRRSTDLVARYGGEEFAIILPNTNANGALFIAQNINKKLTKQKLTHAKSRVSKYVTCSMGISTIVPNIRQSVANIIESADRLLYQAKSSGRNQIAVSHQRNYQKLNA